MSHKGPCHSCGAMCFCSARWPSRRGLQPSGLTRSRRHAGTRGLALISWKKRNPVEEEKAGALYLFLKHLHIRNSERLLTGICSENVVPADGLITGLKAQRAGGAKR